MASILWWYIPRLLAILSVLYVIHTIRLRISHARRARRWGCKPAFVRPYRLPLGIDVLNRYTETANNHELQNDDLVIFEELGRRPTWYQQILGFWHHVTAEPKNIQAMLATQFEDFELGPNRRGVFEPFLGHGIFTMDGKAWEHSRALLRPQFSRSQVSNLELEEDHVQLLFDRILVQSNGWTDELDLGPLFFRLTFDSATEFLFGESVYTQRVMAQKQQDSIEETKEESSKVDWSSFGHYFDEANKGCLTRFRLLDLYFLYNPKSFRDNCREVHTRVDHFVRLALANGDEKIEKEKSQYVFSHELAKVTRNPLELRNQLLHVLLAGRDTTAGLLGFTFYFLARHLEVYSKLRQTILSHFGTGKETITFESLKQCTYLQHVISEVQRLEPVVPENGRRAVRNTTLPRGGGADGLSPIYVPAGQEIIYNTRLMHRRKDIWGEDADEFKPERWLGYKPGWEFLPFNGGPRICLGQQFALTEAGYVIVRILQKYDKIENLDHKPMKHRFTQTTAPFEVLVRFHEADD